MKKLLYFMALASVVLCNVKIAEADNKTGSFFGINKTYQVKSYKNITTDDKLEFQRGEALLTVNDRTVKLIYGGDTIFSVKLTILASGPVMDADSNIRYYKVADNFYDGILAADDSSGEMDVMLLVKIDGVYYISTYVTLY